MVREEIHRLVLNSRRLIIPLGMGNRFTTIPEYHTLVLGHGIVAAITFLGIVPAAILIAKFYYRNPHLALRLHISLQVLTVILATVVLVLGYFAVGPSRSLTNPHHGIGVAIYVLVLVQFIGGAVIHRVEKGKMRYYLPVKLMVSCDGVVTVVLADCPPVASMAWASDSIASCCPDSYRPRVVRLANMALRPLRGFRIGITCSLFRLDLSTPTTSGTFL